MLSEQIMNTKTGGPPAKVIVDRGLIDETYALADASDIHEINNLVHTYTAAIELLNLSEDPGYQSIVQDSRRRLGKKRFALRMRRNNLTLANTLRRRRAARIRQRFSLRRWFANLWRRRSS